MSGCHACTKVSVCSCASALNWVRKASQSQSSRSKKAAGRVSEDVLNDLLPDGPQHFPDDFLTPAARTNLREIPLPEKPASSSGAFFGKEELSDEVAQKSC